MSPITSMHVVRYLDTLRIRNYSPATIYARHRGIVRFYAAVGADPLTVDEHSMIGWWTALKLTPSSRASELAAIRGYCRWAVRHGLIETDPTRLIDRPRLGRRVPRPIGEEALALALRTAADDVFAILTLASFEGMRACEISRLEWSDVRPDTILVHGKGAKERLLPVHPLTQTALSRLSGSHRGPVIRRRDGRGGHVKPWSICQYANTHLHACGVPETLHQLRHRYGTQTYQISKDIRLVQDLLGHESPVTTALYAAWDVTQASGVVFQLPQPVCREEPCTVCTPDGSPT